MALMHEGVTSPLEQAFESVDYIVRKSEGDVAPEFLREVAECTETAYGVVLAFPDASEAEAVDQALGWLGQNESLRLKVTRQVRTAQLLLKQGRLVEDGELIDRAITYNFETPSK